MQLQNLGDVIRRAEKLYGGGDAVACGEVRLTYQQLADRCRRLAGGLAALGVGRGDRVATLMANCHRYLEAYFAVPGIGAVLVPLNNRHAIPEHRYVLDDAEVKVLIVDQAFAAAGQQLLAPGRTLLVAPDGYEQLIEAAEPVELLGAADENDLAGLFYTGGTTGQAKGVM